MKPRIDLVTIVTKDVPRLSRFYIEVLGLESQQDLGPYVELKMEGVRFAICASEVMENATGHPSYHESRRGQSFELAFPVDGPAEVDEVFEQIIERGAVPVCAPADMPWGQRAAFFADPDGNIHEIFSDLNQK